MNKLEKLSKINQEMDHEYYEKKIKELSETENISFLKTLVKFKKQENENLFKNNKKNYLKTEKNNVKESYNYISKQNPIFKTIQSNHQLIDNLNNGLISNQNNFNDYSISSIDFLEEPFSNSQFKEFQNFELQSSNRGINYQEIFKKNKEMNLHKKKKKKIEQFNTKDTISKIDAIINETKKDEQKLLIRPFSQNTLNSKFGIFDYLLPVKSNDDLKEIKQKTDNMNKFKEKRKEIIERRKKKTYLDEAKAKNHSHISSVDLKLSKNIKNIIHTTPYENNNYFKPNTSLTKYPFRQKYNNINNSKNSLLNRTENEKDILQNTKKNIKRIEIVKRVITENSKSLSDKKPIKEKFNRGNKIKSITLKVISPLNLKTLKS